MSVTYKTIIQKMIDELEEAKKHGHNQIVLRKHVNHVQLLCELILDHEVKDKNINDEEMKAMIGDTYKDKQRKNERKSSYIKPEGDSIFNF